MVKFIESELEQLNKEIDEMWILVYSQLENTREAVLTSNKGLAQQVIVREKRVNAFELKIDSDVEDLIALYSPVAIDLRFVLAMFKINTDLERLGDFAEGIARYVVNKEDSIPLDADLLKELQLEKMFDEVLAMLSTAREALLKENIDLTAQVFEKDNILDELNHNSTAILTEYAKNNTDQIPQCFSLSSIFRKLERAGDHITNIAEEIVFYFNAKILKHNHKALMDDMIS